MGWQQLLTIAAEAREARRAEQAAPPQACPRCGEPLRAGPGPVLFCRFDGWQQGAGVGVDS